MALLLLVAFPTDLFAQGFKHAFYRGLGIEYKMPATDGPATLRSGGVLKEAYFIFDRAADITTSKNWIKIQWPYLGRMKATLPPGPKYIEDIYEDIRKVTVVTVRRHRGGFVRA